MSIKNYSAKIIFLAALLFVMCAAAVSAADADDRQYGVINATAVRFREAANLNAEIFAHLNKGDPLTIIDFDGEWYQVIYLDKLGYVFGEYVTLVESSPGAADIVVKDEPVPLASVPAEITGEVELVSWSAGKDILKRGTVATVTDVDTGKSFQIKVMSAGSHADVEPLTAADTATILEIRGKFSFTPRAVWVTVDGRTIAASANGMPHSVSTIKGNNFNGHFCIHLKGSRNHYNNKEDAEHQKMVQKAYKTSPN
ncbi:MAG: SH3 domain-containing protein [Defluviitaleaceae bacterium]|nr:SH3 domain-containing protein [Defluviitaleaceae bacterium]